MRCTTTQKAAQLETRNEKIESTNSRDDLVPRMRFPLLAFFNFLYAGAKDYTSFERD